ENATGVMDAPRGVPCREGPRIMVVDDNVDAAASLADLLQLKGYPVLTAATGEEALEQARSFRPHVIFMDIGLPGIDGVETSLRIHAMPELRDVTVVAVTGWGKPSDRRGPGRRESWRICSSPLRRRLSNIFSRSSHPGSRSRSRYRVAEAAAQSPARVFQCFSTELARATSACRRATPFCSSSIYPFATCVISGVGRTYA